MGRLLLKHGKMYNFDLSTKGGKVEENAADKKCDNKDEQMVVDLEIDGKNGPIPTIVEKKDEK